MNPNVTIRSNIRVGSLADMAAGGKLLHAVRGRAGLKKVLHRIEPGRAELEAASQHLCPEQIAQLVQDPCYECGFFTVGPARTPDGPVLQVRCPRHQCQSLILPTKELLIDRDMLNAINRGAQLHPNLDLSGLIAKTLAVESGRGPTGVETVLRRVGLRLPPVLHFQFYAWADRPFSEVVKARLLEFVQRG